MREIPGGRYVAKPMNRLDFVFDMETGDPDDFLTLLLLLGHPRVNLRAVTLTPGTRAQVGLVQHAVREWFGRDVPVGGRDLDRDRDCVSSFHQKAFCSRLPGGQLPRATDAEHAPDLLRRVCDADTTLVTGGPLRNLREALEGDFTVGRWVAQGGFAGEGVVPRALQLPKFRGKATCPTYNFNGDPKGARAMLAHPGIGRRRLVSKNVCHGVVYDRDTHARVVAAAPESLSLTLIAEGMGFRGGFDRNPKKLHDPLAACCAIDEAVGTWAEVELYRSKGQWGSRLNPGSDTSIIIDYDRERFLDVLTAT